MEGGVDDNFLKNSHLNKLNVNAVKWSKTR